jgi:hypothetical protein
MAEIRAYGDEWNFNTVNTPFKAALEEFFDDASEEREMPKTLNNE